MISIDPVVFQAYVLPRDLDLSFAIAAWRWFDFMEVKGFEFCVY